MWAWSIIYCDEQVTQSDSKWAFPQERVNSDTLDTKTDMVFAFIAFFLLYHHMYSPTRWMISPLFPRFISAETSSDFCQFYRISQSVWIVFSEQTKTLIRSASMRQFYFFVSFSSRGQKHFLPDGSLAVSMYLHLFLNLFLHFLSRHIPNITVPLGKKSNLETW